MTVLYFRELSGTLWNKSCVVPSVRSGDGVRMVALAGHSEREGHRHEPLPDYPERRQGRLPARPPQQP
jgi:hypothetical protein